MSRDHADLIQCWICRQTEWDKFVGYSSDTGDDGWPADPRHPRNNEKPGEWAAKRFHEQILACRRACRAGNYLALIDGLQACYNFQQPPPAWLLTSLKSILVQKKGGVLATNYMHYWRWDVVRDLRDRREELAGFGLEPTWDGAYENAAASLKGTMAEGSPDTMKASYQLVEREKRAGRGSKYFITSVVPERGPVRPRNKPG